MSVRGDFLVEQLGDPSVDAGAVLRDLAQLGPTVIDELRASGRIVSGPLPSLDAWVRGEVRWWQVDPAAVRAGLAEGAEAGARLVAIEIAAATCKVLFDQVAVLEPLLRLAIADGRPSGHSARPGAVGLSAQRVHGELISAAVNHERFVGALFAMRARGGDLALWTHVSAWRLRDAPEARGAVLALLEGVIDDRACSPRERVDAASLLGELGDAGAAEAALVRLLSSCDESEAVRMAALEAFLARKGGCEGDATTGAMAAVAGDEGAPTTLRLEVARWLLRQARGEASRDRVIDGALIGLLERSGTPAPLRDEVLAGLVVRMPGRLDELRERGVVATAPLDEMFWSAPGDRLDRALAQVSPAEIEAVLGDRAAPLGKVLWAIAWVGRAALRLPDRAQALEPALRARLDDRAFVAYDPRAERATDHVSRQALSAYIEVVSRGSPGLEALVDAALRAKAAGNEPLALLAVAGRAHGDEARAQMQQRLREAEPSADEVAAALEAGGEARALLRHIGAARGAVSADPSLAGRVERALFGLIGDLRAAEPDDHRGPRPVVGDNALFVWALLRRGEPAEARLSAYSDALSRLIGATGGFDRAFLAVRLIGVLFDEGEGASAAALLGGALSSVVRDRSAADEARFRAFSLIDEPGRGLGAEGAVAEAIRAARGGAARALVEALDDPASSASMVELIKGRLDVIDHDEAVRRREAGRARLPRYESLLHAGSESYLKLDAAAAVLGAGAIAEGLAGGPEERFVAALLAERVAAREGHEPIATALVAAIEDPMTHEVGGVRRQTSSAAASALGKIVAAVGKRSNDEAQRLARRGLDALLRSGEIDASAVSQLAGWASATGPEAKREVRAQMLSLLRSRAHAAVARFMAYMTTWGDADFDDFAYKAYLDRSEDPVFRDLLGDEVLRRMHHRLTGLVDASTQPWTLLKGSPVDLPLCDARAEAPDAWVASSLVAARAALRRGRALGVLWMRYREGRGDDEAVRRLLVDVPGLGPALVRARADEALREQWAHADELLARLGVG